jgi:hypothetical protein
MKEVKIISSSQGRKIFIDGQELIGKKPSRTKRSTIDDKEAGGMVDAGKMIGARQRHQVTTKEGIVGGSYMSKEQKLTLAIETKEGEEGRILTDLVNRKARIAD